MTEHGALKAAPQRPSLHPPSTISFQSPLTIAILGVCRGLGLHLLTALGKHPSRLAVRIRVLTRPAMCTQLTTARLTGKRGLEATLHGVDVVLSIVGDDPGLRPKDVMHTGLLLGFIAQDRVARMAKATRVRIEYGSHTHLLPLESTWFAVRKRQHIYRTLELPYLLIYSGAPPRSTKPDEIPVPVSSPTPGMPRYETTRPQLASYIVHLLLDRGTDALRNGVYDIHGLKRARCPAGGHGRDEVSPMFGMSD
ncbi:hypothetical protein DFH09DRAFT_1324703 [Mycena vulgaris]|nr:hypothetical protein DFH09DRAFT_1324703 [Mycena vulgaris]